jgi:hypothetical protein
MRLLLSESLTILNYTNFATWGVDTWSQSSIRLLCWLCKENWRVRERIRLLFFNQKNYFHSFPKVQACFGRQVVETLFSTKTWRKRKEDFWVSSSRESTVSPSLEFLCWTETCMSTPSHSIASVPLTRLLRVHHTRLVWLRWGWWSKRDDDSFFFEGGAEGETLLEVNYEYEILLFCWTRNLLTSCYPEYIASLEFLCSHFFLYSSWWPTEHPTPFESKRESDPISLWRWRTQTNISCHGKCFTFFSFFSPDFDFHDYWWDLAIVSVVTLVNYDFVISCYASEYSPSKEEWYFCRHFLISWYIVSWFTSYVIEVIVDVYWLLSVFQKVDPSQGTLNKDIVDDKELCRIIKYSFFFLSKKMSSFIFVGYCSLLGFLKFSCGFL